MATDGVWEFGAEGDTWTWEGRNKRRIHGAFMICSPQQILM